MKILVQKFGGTSVSTAENREKVVDKIVAAKEAGYMPVVVVSAMGRKGEPYSTDTLIEFAKKANGKIQPRELDLIMSCGETISSVIMAAMLRARGLPSVALTGENAGIITDDNFGNASVIRVEVRKLFNHLDKGNIPVVTGFQGVTEYGDITTLGRGGSDVTAAILGEALNAHMIEIYTDVDGVMTADPRIVPDARVISSVDYNEVFQMADYGAKVIHPNAVEIAMRSNVPLVIKNTFSKSPGTLVTQFRRDTGTVDLDGGLLTGIAYLKDRAQVIIDYGGTSNSSSDHDDILEKLAEIGVSIDLINIFTDKKIFTVDAQDAPKVDRLLKKEGLDYRINGECCKVTAIGSKIRGVPGVMARILRALANNGITVYQTADSYTTISVLVKSDDAERAVLVLHNEFKLNKK
jgi:aspartate kinase